MNYILVFFTCMSCEIPFVHEVAFFETARECIEKRQEYKNWSAQCFSIRNAEIFKGQP